MDTARFVTLSLANGDRAAHSVSGCPSVMRHAARVITGFPSFSPSLTDMLYGFSGRWMKCCLVSSDVNWHIRDKLWPVPKHRGSSVFTSTKTRRFVRTDSPGRPPRLSHSSWTMPFCGLPMMMMSWCLMSSDVIWHIRDKLWPMPKPSGFNNSLRPRKPEGSLGRTARARTDVHLDSPAHSFWLWFLRTLTSSIK